MILTLAPLLAATFYLQYVLPIYIRIWVANYALAYERVARGVHTSHLFDKNLEKAELFASWKPNIINKIGGKRVCLMPNDPLIMFAPPHFLVYLQRLPLHFQSQPLKRLPLSDPPLRL